MSVTVDVPDPPVICRENQAVVGVDWGISALATLCTGEKIRSPKAYAAATPKLRRLSKPFSRQMAVAKVRGRHQPGRPIPNGMHMPRSQNMVKAARRIARWHARIANIRADALNPVTTMLGERFDGIGTEDLNVAGMLKNHKRSRAAKDRGLGEFRRQLTDKAAQRGKTVVVVDRGYRSSKTCSTCGYKQGQMPLACASVDVPRVWNPS